jgi:hypothetical protein
VADLTPSRRTTLNLVSLTLVGKVLAIGKTLFIAALFGTSSHLDAFWVAYQASTEIVTKMSRTNALSLAYQMCAQEGANPGGIMAAAQSRHASPASLQETSEMLQLVHGLCG